jgi:hypothetical protein
MNSNVERLGLGSIRITYISRPAPAFAANASLKPMLNALYDLLRRIVMKWHIRLQRLPLGSTARI